MAVIGLSPLIACSLEADDRGLIFAFVERWYKETSSFHLPVGEVTITQDDVASLLHLLITSTSIALRLFMQMKSWTYQLTWLNSVQKKQEMRHCNVMGHMFGYPGCETFTIANVTQDSGLQQLKHIFCIWQVAHFLLTRMSHSCMWYSWMHFVTSAKQEAMHGEMLHWSICMRI